MLDPKEIFLKHREFAMYIICGGFTILVSWLSYAVFVWAGIDLNVSNVASWVCGVTFAFVVNKWLVFSSKSVEASVIAKELGSFFGARILTGVIAAFMFPALLGLGMDQSVFGVAGDLAKGVTSGLEIALNYVLSKYLVFARGTSAAKG
ncbi:MAG: GtrA family protein [Candidatus Methanoplasma sp.]|jgi:putative flippase GtrA|nr:GtrA family protein [Candidatus Methanoplasma sp.]